MAKIAEQYVVIKISKLVKDNAKNELAVMKKEAEDSVVAVIEELIQDDGCIVEIHKDD